MISALVDDGAIMMTTTDSTEKEGRHDPPCVLGGSDIRDCVFFLNNISGCENDIDRLEETCKKLGFDCKNLESVTSYKELRKKTIENLPGPNASVIVFFFGYGYDEYMFLTRDDSECVSYKKFLEAFSPSSSRPHGGALMLFTNVCFKYKKNKILTSSKNPRRDIFHVCVQVNGQCESGSLLTTAVLKVIKERGTNADFFDFVQLVTNMVEKLQEEKESLNNIQNSDEYICETRYQGVCGSYYFNILPKQDVVTNEEKDAVSSKVVMTEEPQRQRSLQNTQENILCREDPLKLLTRKRKSVKSKNLRMKKKKLSEERSLKYVHEQEKGATLPSRKAKVAGNELYDYSEKPLGRVTTSLAELIYEDFLAEEKGATLPSRKAKVAGNELYDYSEKPLGRVTTSLAELIYEDFLAETKDHWSSIARLLKTTGIDEYRGGSRSTRTGPHLHEDPSYKASASGVRIFFDIRTNVNSTKKDIYLVVEIQNNQEKGAKLPSRKAMVAGNELYDYSEKPLGRVTTSLAELLFEDFLAKTKAHWSSMARLLKTTGIGLDVYRGGSSSTRTGRYLHEDQSYKASASVVRIFFDIRTNVNSTKKNIYLEVEIQNNQDGVFRFDGLYKHQLNIKFKKNSYPYDCPPVTCEKHSGLYFKEHFETKINPKYTEVEQVV